MSDTFKQKPDTEDLPLRSPALLSRQHSTLLVVDVQEKLLPAIQKHDTLCWNIRRLLLGAQILGVPSHATEQYPRGLGHTVPELRELVEQPLEKLMFSCRECASLFQSSAENGRHQLVLTGIETHVCVLQTALDSLASGFDVFLVVDAVGSRFQQDMKIALERMQSCGAHLVTTESVLFEWCEKSGTAEFKQISQLVKETPPTATN